ncbi:hypothetical protein F4561_000883 [Lipingzhangella halophila]|uniref:Lipoprotein n=1 Tax=Lipingzhangella halophila TaxID=1783352 RepID=A0A7W7RDN6_9ACTN|nr:hypothetical protein [Lipingzhangella halophila]MBB4930063.1 hypothetical protein [Lipingzhangella halophila]
MPNSSTSRPWRTAFLCAVLLAPTAACGGQGDEPDGPPAMESVDTDRPTYDPSPEPDSMGETAIIGQTQQATVNGLRIGVVSTRDGEADVSIGSGPGIDEDNPEKVSGEADDSVTLDNGYTITFEEIENSDPDAGGDDEAGGTGSVRLTVTPPEE